MKNGIIGRAIAKKAKTAILIILKDMATSLVSGKLITASVSVPAYLSPLAEKMLASQKTAIRATKQSSMTNLNQNPQNIP